MSPDAKTETRSNLSSVLRLREEYLKSPGGKTETCSNRSNVLRLVEEVLEVVSPEGKTETHSNLNSRKRLREEGDAGSPDVSEVDSVPDVSVADRDEEYRDEEYECFLDFREDGERTPENLLDAEKRYKMKHGSVE